jgi:hypothetical protein
VGASLTLQGTADRYPKKRSEEENQLRLKKRIEEGSGFTTHAATLHTQHAGKA